MGDLRSLLRNIKARLTGEHRMKWPEKKRQPDAQLVSYPKCGRTWLRLMLGRALQQHFDLRHPDIKAMTLNLEILAELDPAVPKVAIYHDDDPQWKKPEELETDKSRYAGQKVLFLVRDPRDVMISTYFEMKKRVKQYANEMAAWVEPHLAERIRVYTGELDDWIDESWGSISTIVAYYNPWAENRDRPRAFHLVRYEDLHRDAATQLRGIFEFLGVTDMDPEVITEAIEYTRFENMRKMEQQDAFHTNALRPADASDSESYKTRKGKVGGFREYLSDQQIERLNQRLRNELSPMYGYPEDDA